MNRFICVSLAYPFLMFADLAIAYKTGWVKPYEQDLPFYKGIVLVLGPALVIALALIIFDVGRWWYQKRRQSRTAHS